MTSTWSITIVPQSSAPCPFNDPVCKIRHAPIGKVRIVDATAEIDPIVMKQPETRVDEHLFTRAGELVHFVHPHLIDQRRHDDALGALAERKDRLFSARLQQGRQIEALHLIDGAVLEVVRPLQPEEDVTEHEHGGRTAQLAS